MANAPKLHQLKAAAQYSGEAVQRFVDSLAARLGPDKANDALDFARSNAITTTGTAIKASAGRLYGLIIEPAATAATGTGGTGYVTTYNAATVTGMVQGGVTAGLLAMEAIKFVTGMTRCIAFDPAQVDNTSLYNSGISVYVATTPVGTTAVASLPTVTGIYA
jgi:hypothetical protein